MWWPWKLSESGVARPLTPAPPRQRADVTPTLRRHHLDEDCRYAPATEHAVLLLAWLQGPGGRTGWLTFRELLAAYIEMAAEERLAPHPWPPVGGALRRLIVQPKRYATRQRVRMWWIPPARPELVVVAGRDARHRA